MAPFVAKEAALLTQYSTRNSTVAIRKFLKIPRVGQVLARPLAGGISNERQPSQPESNQINHSQQQCSTLLLGFRVYALTFTFLYPNNL